MSTLFTFPMASCSAAVRWSLLTVVTLLCLVPWTVVGLTDFGKEVRAIALDYKIHIDAGKEDCYYQYIMPKTVMYVEFQVIKGGDGQAGFAVKDPSGRFVLPYEWKPQSSYNVEEAIGGYYALCIDNQFSKFSAKLVSVYLNSYMADDWTRYASELEALHVSVSNFTTTLSSVDKNLAQVLTHLHHSRVMESRDSAILHDNNWNVSFWSMVQCVIIVGAGTFQIFFIRKLFDSPTSSGKMKMRT